MKARKLGLIVVLCAIVAALSLNVFADTQCSSQDCSANTTLTVGNSPIGNPIVETGVTVTLTAETNTTAYIHFNVSDANGADDINDTTANCYGYKSGEATRTTSGCVVESEGTGWEYFNCSVDFWYFDAAASDWAWNCSISDNTGTSGYNDSVVFTVNALHYIDQDIVTYAWSSAQSGVNDQEADAQINLDNGGNQDYGTAAVTAYNATDGGTNIIPANTFYLNSATGTPAGTQMSDGTPVAITSWFTLPHGNQSSEDMYAYVDLPSVPAASYASTSNWLIDITT